MSIQKIEAFIAKHHILSLATCKNNIPYSSTMFYAYDQEHKAFIISSDANSRHTLEALHNPNVSGSVALETKEVGKIEGIQFIGEFETLTCKESIERYFKAYPYARLMAKHFYLIRLKWIKLTDNRLGFGTKLTWDASA